MEQKPAPIDTIRLMRWSAAISILPAIALPFYNQFLHGGREAAEILPRSAAYAEAHMLGATCSLLLIFGLLAVYLRLSGRTGKLGLAGFMLATLAQGLYAGSLFIDGFFNPILAKYDPVLQTHIHSPQFYSEATHILGLAFLFLPLVSVLYVVGYVIFSVALIRANILPKAIGYLMIVGSILLSIAIMIPQWLESLGYAALGGAVAWASWRIWQDTKVTKEG